MLLSLFREMLGLDHPRIEGGMSKEGRSLRGDGLSLQGLACFAVQILRKRVLFFASRSIIARHFLPIFSINLSCSQYMSVFRVFFLFTESMF